MAHRRTLRCFTRTLLVSAAVLILTSCGKDSTEPKQPDIEVTPSVVTMSAESGGAAVASLTVGNIGEGELEVTQIVADTSWLSVIPAAFKVAAGGSQGVVVAGSVIGLGAGLHSAILTIMSNDPDEGSVVVPVSINVARADEPDIEVSPDSLSFTVMAGYDTSQVLAVWNVGNVPLSVMSITDDAEWLTVSPPSSSLAPSESQDIDVRVDASELSSENYTAALMITSNDPDEPTVTVPVALTVLPQGQPEINVTPTSLSFEVQRGSSEYQTLTVSNTGDAVLNVSLIDGDAAWLTGDPASFTVNAGWSRSVTVSVRAANLIAGSYSGMITMASNDPDQAIVTVTVALIVTGGANTIVEMVAIASGTFQMGSDNQWAWPDYNEGPVHQVTISAFSMAKYEVTNEEMRAVMQWAYENGLVSATGSKVTNAEGDSRTLLFFPYVGSETRFSNGTFSVESGKENHPCSNVTWYGAQAFCNYLSDMEGKNRCISFNDWSCTWSANGYRLPTEAEWEYACRAGTTTDYYSGDETASRCGYDPKLDEIGWYCGNGDGGTEDVGQKPANDWGLKDMSGNVWEWCNDWYENGYYDESPSQDPTGPGTGLYRVIRGGRWNFYAEYCRSASRGAYSPGYMAYYPGFRPAKRLMRVPRWESREEAERSDGDECGEVDGR